MAAKITLIEDQLENLNSGVIQTLWNDYCDSKNDCDSCVYPIEYIDDLFYGLSPLDILRKVSDRFNPYDEYFYINGYGNLVSTDDVWEAIDLTELAKHIVETGNYKDIQLDKIDIENAFFDEFLIRYGVNDEEGFVEFFKSTYDCEIFGTDFMELDWDYLYEEYNKYHSETDE